MSNQKLSYEEQVLVLGNGKMLEPGCYDENRNWLCDVDCLLKRETLPKGVDTDLIHHVIMPEGITKIAHSMFFDLRELESVVLPESLEEIGESAFCFCFSLKELHIPSRVKRLCNCAFQCSGLVSLFLPASVESFGYLLCADCKGLVTFRMPEANLTETNTYGMFNGNKNLTNVILPKGLEEIDKNTFLNCVSLKTITLPSTVKRINEFAFVGCKSLELVKIPHGIEFISPKAFGPVKIWAKQTSTIIEFDGYQMTVSDIEEKSVLARIYGMMTKIDNAKKPRLTDLEIDVVMQALAGNPILTSSEFADKVERILRQ